METSICKSCHNRINSKEPSVACGGLCTNAPRFHAVCVGLTVVEGHACSNPNIFWVCNGCRNSMKAKRAITSYEDSSSKQIDCLKNEIGRMNAVMDKLVHTVESISTSLVVRESSAELDKSQLPGNSSMLTSTKFQCEDGSHSTKEDNISLFVSNIANDVTEEEVEQMVNGVIGLNAIVSIKCLVPPWKEKSSLDYISFKIVVDTTHNHSTLSKMNWPKGIRCREFKDRLNETWRPSYRIN